MLPDLTFFFFFFPFLFFKIFQSILLLPLIGIDCTEVLNQQPKYGLSCFCKVSYTAVLGKIVAGMEFDL